MALNWDEFRAGVIAAAAAEQAGAEPAGLRTMEQFQAFLTEYDGTGKTYRELFADARFAQAYAWLIAAEAQRRGGQNYEQQRISDAIREQALSPLQAMLLHEIDWF